MAVFKKNKFLLSCHFQIEKKSIMRRKIQGEKLIQTLICPKQPRAYEE